MNRDTGVHAGHGQGFTEAYVALPGHLSSHGAIEI